MIDPEFLIRLASFGAACIAVGWSLCWATHKQRGIEVDRPVTDMLLPGPPPPIVVPDDASELTGPLEEVP